MDDPKFDGGWIEDGCWDYYSGLPNPSWYSEPDDGEVDEM